MKIERLKASLEVYGLKAKAKAKMAIMLVGVALVLIGGYNMLAVPYLDTTRVAMIPALGYLGSEGAGIFLLGDVLSIAVGAAAVWLS